MDKPYTGGCACGAIRYEIFGEPVFSNDCQCRDDGPRLASDISPASTGQAKHWDMTADSGNVKTRAFCPDCGAPVYMTFSAMPDIFTIRAASLDEPARYKPQVVTYAARGHGWDRLDPSLPKFEQMPPM